MATNLFGQSIETEKTKPRSREIPEYTLKPDRALGLTLIRYCGRWVPQVFSFIGKNIGVSEDHNGNEIHLAFDEGGHLILPNGRRTRFYYH